MYSCAKMWVWETFFGENELVVVVLDCAITFLNCFARDSMKSIKLNNTGKLYSYSIVFRSFPGIKVPYISAIVDLDGGGTVKGNLIDCEPDPDQINFDMPVEVIFDDALGRKDKDGNSYISYFFKPIK